VIAPVYMRLGRFDDAVEARRKAIALNGDSAAREADLGEALAAAANGVVTADAKQAFERAVAGDPHDPRPAIFSASPTSRTATARLPPPNGAPCSPRRRRRAVGGFVRAALARVTGAPAAGPAAERGRCRRRVGMNDDAAHRDDPRHGARLADRLHANGSDVEGWLRLVRAYVVLGDRDKAKDAAADAKRALADHPDEIKRIDDLVKGLGLEG
jgi:cytochrome c-type biogenesis protein CcmH